ncbi:MAG: NAD-dependent epimerase/dehydratase family protein [Anaerolineales bacterium]|nr:MAG: NAD-dependent epimerase/dehydratase family protein [Anaerolineales bacterium]
MRVLITGGAGFIGSALAHRLIAEGHQVSVVDNLSTGKQANIPQEAEFVEYDLAKADCLNHLPAGKFDAVCHLAAQSSGPASIEMPYYDLQVNAASTLLLSRWCLKNNTSRFLYASSMTVYGNKHASPVSEDAVCEPIAYYGVSKLASEHLLRLASLEGLQATSFRMFSVYGPGQNLGNMKQGMASIFMAYLLRGEEVPVTGPLERFRDFIYIDDVIDAWINALNMKQTPSPIYNLGTGKATTVRELLKTLMDAMRLDKNHPIKELPGSAFDQFGLTANISLAEKELNWKPKMGLSDGLRKMAAWAKKEVL